MNKIISKLASKLTNSTSQDDRTEMLPEKGKRLILTHSLSLRADGQSSLNTLVIGNPETGVETAFIEPNLLDMPEDTSFVISDPSGALWEETHEQLKKAGYYVVYFNPGDKERSFKYNPLDYCHGEDDVLSLADILFESTINYTNTDDFFFQNAEKHLLRAVLLYICTHCGDRFYDDSLSLIIEYAEKYADEQEHEFDDYSKACEDKTYGQRFREEHAFVKSLSDQELRSAINILTGKFLFTALDDFRELTGNDQCKVHTQFNSRTAIFIGFDEKDNTYNFLSRMLFAECVKEVVKRCDGYGCQPYHVRFVVHGIAKLGNMQMFLPGFPDILTAYSKNISFQMTTSTLDEALNTYGPEWKDIMEHFPNILYLGTAVSDLTFQFLLGRAGTDAGFENGVDRSLSSFSEWASASDVLVLIRGRKPYIDKKYGFMERLGIAPDNENLIILSCGNDKCPEPTKKIVGHACGPRRSHFTYTCKYFKNGEPCPYSNSGR